MNSTVQMYHCFEGTDTGSPALVYRESGTGVPDFATICCSDLADFIKKAIELETIESPEDLYGDDDDLILDEYIEREKRGLLYMKKHPEIRKIVEEQIGKPITSIWKMLKCDTTKVKTHNREVLILISKCGIYTSQGKRVLLATRAVVNGRKAVAYVKNGQLQGYEYLDDFNEQCYSGPYMTFEDKKEQLRM